MPPPPPCRPDGGLDGRGAGHILLCKYDCIYIFFSLDVAAEDQPLNNVMIKVNSIINGDDFVADEGKLVKQSLLFACNVERVPHFGTKPTLISRTLVSGILKGSLYI